MSLRPPEVRNPHGNLGQQCLVRVLRAYQRYFSPLLPPSCRFSPTCSQYAIEAIVIHGLAKGVWLALRRILRCHPFHPGGFDPVRK